MTHILDDAPAARAGAVTFDSFAFAQPIARALAAAGFSTPTPVQAAAIPALLAGRDMIAIAQTGTGKTAAFALPMLQRLHDAPRRAEPKRARMVVLSPTRELAIQIAETFETLGARLRFSLATIFGGVSERGQIEASSRGIDVLVATPGRLLDLVERKLLHLDRVEVFVLDEADRMLDMGFVREVRKLVRLLPKERRSLLFSATMPPAIREIARDLLTDPVEVAVTPEVVTVEKIAQSVYHVPAQAKRALLAHILSNEDMSRVVVFCRTKHGANKVTDYLDAAGFSAAAIHGNKSQNARQAALAAFRNGEARILVATDIASRGIDVPGITHVVNFELPEEPEAYVHRIGRTARAGRDGVAISLCSPEERGLLRDIERLTKVRPTVETMPELARVPAEAAARPARQDRAPNHGRDERRAHQPRQERSRAHARPEAGERPPAREHGKRPPAPQASDQRGRNRDAPRPAALAAAVGERGPRPEGKRRPFRSRPPKAR